MIASNFSLADYYARIAHHGSAGPDLATLHNLMRAQLFSIPFENLDTQAGKIVSMVPEDIVQKLLHNHRGGYCFEVNGLFAMALTALSIPHRMVAARPMLYHDRRPKTHMAIIAELEGRQWLCDLGFGSYGIRAPIALDMANQSIQQDGDAFRLQENAATFLLQARVDDEWKSQFEFDLSPQEWVDFLPANFYSSTYPGSLFVQKLVVIQHTPQGRKILFDHHYRNIQHGKTSKREVNAADISKLLLEEFGLAVN
jgi:N-hydroxyarylamine O-acetyltransferase